MTRSSSDKDLTRGLDIDDPRTTHLRLQISQEESFLQQIYQEWYRAIVRATKRALARWAASSKAKPKERKAQGKRVLEKVAQLAKYSVAQSRQSFHKLSKSAPTPLKQRLFTQIELAEKLLQQTDNKLDGQRSIPERIVSFWDAEAIVRGRLDKPVEFRRTLELVQDSSGVILHYEVHQGNPSDKTYLVSLIRQTKKILRKLPREIAADRGFYSAENLLKLRRLRMG